MTEAARRAAARHRSTKETTIDVVLDLDGSGAADVTTGIPFFDHMISQLGQLAEEFWRAFATAAGMTLHLRMRSGKNAHHVLEASFKGVARCLRDAVRIEGSGVPSTKGTL
jgi:imidazoleglycerol-phosphate dehydratase